MTSKERVRVAMGLGIPDRVPVMCQLSLGHYFLHAGRSPMEIWYTSEGFAEALITMAERYEFDGVLINLPGREPDFEKQISRVEKKAGETIVRWRNGNYTILPDADNPHYYQSTGARYFPTFEALEPERLFYVDPWDITEITYPFTWGFESEPRPDTDFFPAYHFDTVKKVLAKVGSRLSVHAEIFSPWSQFMELLNYEQALMAIMDDPGKVRACLERLTDGAIALAKRYAALGVDAILISSAFAGASLISRKHYLDFVLPFEAKIISEIHREFSQPVYTHTCGSIGDRLDLMIASGTNGIDTLDPPPLGTVDLAEAKKRLGGKVFLKGNIDPVNTLLRGDAVRVQQDVKWRLEVGKVGGGYILSSACSVAPDTSPENLELLARMAKKFGRYA